MRDHARALQLVEQIYRATVEPAAWDSVLRALSEELGGAAIQISLRLPDEEPSPDDFHSFGIDESYHPVFLKLTLEGLPWGSLDHSVFRGRFGSASELLLDQDIDDSALYLDFMRPQGLAPEWPLCHLIALQDGRPMSGIVIYPREGGRRIDSDDLALLDSLVPHLARAYSIHRELRQARHETDVLKMAINRLPTGVLLLDAEGRVVLTNTSANDILAQDDGFSLRRGQPWLSDERRNRALHEALEACLEQVPSRGRPVGEVVAVPRPSGRRGFSIMLIPLLAGAPGSREDEMKAILFVADPEIGQVGTTEVLESLYDLTHAEADLVRLIAEGHSLDQVAGERGVTMNTVRSQLKQVFSKTDTCRQGELVHLVLAGVARIRGERRSD
ncbi:MAG: helix-turn-helix transcriptional regulator [Deltaproteobacteria bacterium]|nr:helix-turn-helix transcriptional regulator [Deltaproteobacteria bacterium]MBW2363429.1 helix-turn-helix transcriptional regulator [Deltaproteobacteria bacterium]